MRWTRSALLFSILAATVLTAAETEPAPTPLTTEEAVALAREHADRVLAATARLQAGYASDRLTRSELYPQISARAGYARVASRDIESGFGIQEIDDHDEWTAGARVEQLLYGFGLRRHLQASGEAQIAGAQAQHAIAVRDAELLTRDAIARYALAGAVIDVSRRRLQRLRDEQQKLNDLLAAGLSDELQVREAELAIITGRNALMAAENEQRIQHLIVAETLALDPDRFVLQVVLDTPADLQAWALAAENATASGPEIRAALAQEAELQAASGLARSRRLPQLHAFAAADTVSWEFDDPHEGYSLGLSLQWQIYAGGRYRAEEEFLALQGKEVELQARALLRTRGRRIASLLSQVGSLAERIGGQRQAVELAAANYTSAEALFGNGLIDRTRLQDFNLSIAETEFTLAALIAEMTLVGNQLRALAAP